ncbi:MAG: hypothetical protein AB8B73_03755 [Ekhidna sp.]
MAKTIKEKREQLAAREQELKKELDLNSEGLREKAKQVGKIALVSGGVALLGFWIYKAFFEDEDTENVSKKSIKRKKAMKGVSTKLTDLAMPYIGKVLESVFSNDDEKKIRKD